MCVCVSSSFPLPYSVNTLPFFNKYSITCIHCCFLYELVCTYVCMCPPTFLQRALVTILTSPTPACPPTSDNSGARGRCGPKFNNQFCSGNSYHIYCNEDNGWCGDTQAHRNAQASTKYDARSLPTICRPAGLYIHTT